MNDFLNYALQSSICFGVFYLFYHTALRSEKSFQFNRFYLLATALLSIILPVLEFGFSQENIATSTINYIALQEITIINDVAVQGTLDWHQIIEIIYVIGFVFFLSRLVFQLYKIKQIIFQNRHTTTYHKGASLIFTRGTLPTFSFMKHLFWDDSLVFNEVEKEQILNHELVHIHQKHSWDVLFFEVLGVVFWFNPIIKFYKRAVSTNHEFIADAVVSQNSYSKHYPSLIVRQLFNYVDLSIGSYFNQSQTLLRIKMLKQTAKKTPIFKLLMSIPLAMILMLIMSFKAGLALKNTPITDSMLPETISNTLPDEEEIFTIVEEQPFPTGGMGAFYKYVAENLHYPDEAKKNGIEGKVFAKFMVDKNGNLTDITILKGIGHGCDKETIKVLENSPKWIAGKNGGKTVKVWMTIPIIFKLGSSE